MSTVPGDTIPRPFCCARISCVLGRTVRAHRDALSLLSVDIGGRELLDRSERSLCFDRIIRLICKCGETYCEQLVIERGISWLLEKTRIRK